MPSQTTFTTQEAPLAALRAVEPTPSASIVADLDASRRQAALLRRLLDIEEPGDIFATLQHFPGFDVSIINDLPMAATAFWGNKRWNIHVRGTDSPGLQIFHALHELKHIIDHPRRIGVVCEPKSHSAYTFEVLADYFAGCVLRGEPTVTDQPDNRRTRR
jgi:hypothetical protein